VTECTAASAKTFFESGPTVDLATGNLTNQTTGGAKLVQVELLNDQLRPINLVSNTNSQTAVVTDGTGILNYYARYIATGAATAGQVNTSVRFSLQYN
jgi:major type 1 subunit fimbrin (pilin)